MNYKKHIDIMAGLYTDNFPIISLSKKDFFENYINRPAYILKDNIWFKYLSKERRENILERMKKISLLAPDIINLVKTKYPNLIIKHISIGGSYPFRIGRVNDIDFNVIVEGSHFSYHDDFDITELNKKLPDAVKRISIMIFGENNLLGKNNSADVIETEDYIHTGLCLREGLVFSMRNVPIYGCLFESRNLDKKNMQIRVRRQLFHAQLMLERKVDLHRDNKARLIKSIGRIAEAFLYLSVVFPTLKLIPLKILAKEEKLLKSLCLQEVADWLFEAQNYTKQLSQD